MLALAILGLAQAALRAASRLSPAGIERAIVAAVFAVATAVLETLALGLIGLGSNTFVLVLAAALTWAAAHAWLPSPEVGLAREMAQWWRRLSPAGRAGTAALLGLAGAWVAWQLRYPSIGFDGSIYHYAEIAGWVHNGRPGSILSLSYDLPYGNYPVTDEVAQTWAAGIARSFIPLALWNPAMFVLLGAATWLTIRNLEVPRVPAALATAGLLALPLLVHQLNEPQTDLPDMTWLACTAALATSAGRNPALLTPAIVAAGLAVGTKTTPVLLAAGALAAGLWLGRAHLRRLARPLLLALLGAVLVGGVWYVRNFLQHGSPVWPFAAAPWGDPVPRFLALVDATLIAHPLTTVRENLSSYSDGLAGGVVLIAAIPVTLLVAALGFGLGRSLRRNLLVAAALSALALLAFATAPGTGPQRYGFLFGPPSTLRYILPTLGGAVVALALATRARGLIGAAASVALVGSLAWSVIRDAQLGFPSAPSARTLIAGAAAGVGVWAVAAFVWPRAARLWSRAWRVPRSVLVGCAAVLAGLALASASNGYMRRHAHVAKSTALGNAVVAWFVAQPWFAGSHQPIAFVSRAVDAPLAGDHFTHPLILISPHASCAEIQAAARKDAVVVTPPDFLRNFIGVQPYKTDRCMDGRRAAYRSGPFSVYLPSSSQ